MSDDEAERLFVALHTSAWTMWLMFLEGGHLPLLKDDGRQKHIEWATNKLEAWVAGDTDPPSDYCTCYEMICDYSEVLSELRTVKILRYMVKSLLDHGTTESYAADINHLLEEHQLEDTLTNRVRAQRVWAARVSYDHYNNIISQMAARCTSRDDRSRFTKSMQALLEFFNKVLDEMDKEPEMPPLPETPTNDDSSESETTNLSAAPSRETNGVLGAWDASITVNQDPHQRSLLRRVSVKDNLTHAIIESKKEADAILAYEKKKKKHKKGRISFGSVSRRKKKKRQKGKTILHDRSQSSGGIEPAHAVSVDRSSGTLSLRYQAKDDSEKHGSGFFRSRSGSSVGKRPDATSRSESESGIANDDEGEEEDDQEDEDGADEEEHSGGSLTNSHEESIATLGAKLRINRFALRDFIAKCWSYLASNGCTNGMAAFLANYEFPKQTLKTSPDARADDAINVISGSLALSPDSFIYQAIRKACETEKDSFDTRFAEVRNHFLDNCDGVWPIEHDNIAARLTVYRHASETLRGRIASLEHYFFMAFDVVSDNEQLRNLQFARDALNRAFDATVTAMQDAIRTSAPTAKLASVIQGDSTFKKIQQSGNTSLNRRRNRSCVTVGASHRTATIGSAFADDDD